MFKFLSKISEIEDRIKKLELSITTLTLKVKALNELFYQRLEEKYADKDGKRTPKKPTRKRDNR
jgi:hypothetical protein